MYRHPEQPRAFTAAVLVLAVHFQPMIFGMTTVYHQFLFWTQANSHSVRAPKCNYRRVPPVSAPPPYFFHIERIGIVNAPPLVYPPPPFSKRPLSRYFTFDRVLLPVISHPTLPPCIMKFQNVRDISQGTWPTIYSLSLHARCSRHDHRSRPVGVAVVVRQLRGSKHFFVNMMSPHNYNATCRLQLLSMAAVRTP